MKNLVEHFGRAHKIILCALCFFSHQLFSQDSAPVYPKLAGYFSVVNPIATFSKDGTITNFSSSYTVGFPTGINILKSDKLAFSFEVTPFIKAENGSSKMANLLFHPGIVFRRKNRFSITERLAFETSGRYGTTTVFTKVVKRYQSSNLFLAIPIPLRFGNGQSTSIGVSFQIGLTF